MSQRLKSIDRRKIILNQVKKWIFKPIINSFAWGDTKMLSEQKKRNSVGERDEENTKEYLLNKMEELFYYHCFTLSGTVLKGWVR